MVQILRVLQDYQFHRVETVFHQGVKAMIWTLAKMFSST